MSSTSVSILNIDAEPAFRKSVAAYLEDSGFTMFEAASVDEALGIFREKKPDLIISGLTAPVDRIDLLSAIKKESPETPVVVVASKEDSNEVLEALREGAWDFIFKPVKNMTVLEHTVCRALERGRLVTENKNYRAELEQKNVQLSQSLFQLKEDQKAGRSLQQKLLPKSSVSFKNYTISHTVIPSLYLSGDFVDYFEINEEKVGFYIADVSGHGASSAFVTVLLKSLVDQFLANYHQGHDNLILHPEKMLKRISDDMLNTKLGKYLTMIYGILDVNKNSLTYCIGGHYPSPVIYDGQKSKFLEGNGFAVGIFKKAYFTTEKYTLPDEFALAMFSDGIFEIMKDKNLDYKERKILHVFDAVTMSPTQVLKNLCVTNSANYPDDITLLMINRNLS